MRIKITQATYPRNGWFVEHVSAEGRLVSARFLETWGQVISYLQGM
jgi:hypothetical protein